MSKYNRRANYDRVCTSCGFHYTERKSKTDMCSRPVSLVDGHPLPVRCLTARQVDGSCGPEGRHFSDARAVRRQAAE